MYPLPSAPPQGGRIPATYSTSGKPTKRSRLTPGDPSPNRMNKRALTWSQADSSRRGGNPRSPRTSISARVPRGPLSAFLSARRVSLRTCRQGASPRGPTPLSLLPRRRRRRSAPCPSATPLSAAGPGKPSNGPLPPPRGPGGGLAGAAPPRAPWRAASRATPGQQREREAAARKPGGSSVSPPRDRITTLPWPADGSLRGAHWGQQVRLRARARPGEGCKF